MATVLFQAIGTGAAGPIGGAVGGALGAIFDNQVLYPAIFGENIQGPHLEELRYQGGDEGNPINYCLGPENRVGGTVIWMSDLIEDKRVKRSGLLGTGPKTTTYKYFQSAAIVFNDGAVSDIPKLWNGNDLFFDDDPDITIVSQNFYITIRETYKKVDDVWVVDERYMRVVSPVGSPDLNDFRTGLDIQSTGWGNANNNGTFRATWSGYLSGGESYIELLNMNAVAESATATDKTLYEDVPEFNTSWVKSISRYSGTQLIGGSPPQNPDPVIEAVEGAGNVPAYREFAYVVLERVNVTDTRGQLPTIEALIDEGSTTVRQAIGKIMERNKRLTSADYDTTGVDATKLNRGYVISGPQEPAVSLRQLLLAHDILVQDRDGVLSFFDRDQAEEIAVDDEDFAAHREGDDTDRVVVITDDNGLTLPSEVNVGYLDPEQSYQPGNQRQRLRSAPTESVINAQFALVLSPIQAREIALRMLWIPWANRQGVRGFFMPSYFGPAENDVLTFNAHGEAWRVILSKVERGANYLRTFEGVVERASVLDFEDVTAESGTPPGSDIIPLPGELYLFIIDIAAFASGEDEIPGVYAAAAIIDPDEFWPGAVLYESADGTNFEEVGELSAEASIGFTEAELGSATAGYWDDENTIDVEFYEDGEGLESKTDLEVFNGANWFLFGNEIIGAANVTLLSSRRYRFSRLLRGLRDTEGFISDHHTGEIVVHIDGGGVDFDELPIGAVDAPRWFKAVPEGTDPDDVDAVQVTDIAMGTILPWGPTMFTGVRAGTGSPVGGDSIQIFWVRRGRAYRDDGDMPLLEPREEYEVEFHLGTSSTIVRTARTYMPSILYTEAEMTEDGNTKGDPVKVTVCQISAAIGRGKTTTATVG